ncbi:hypothetical protein LZS85_18780 [Aliivibrio fischeri]|uniref:hypothetical protein n=1 Tax=Aliivibrio fischeri TaxID=668 RepID=UPI001F4187AB|nr:hypothetical protein [Aliivibrio fischeri]MCE7568178.1 hypothetical protein [Aliivibrio fischeri]
MTVKNDQEIRRLKRLADVYDEKERRKRESAKIVALSCKKKKKVQKVSKNKANLGKITFSAKFYKITAKCINCKVLLPYEEIKNHMKKKHGTNVNESFQVICPFCNEKYTFVGLTRHLKVNHSNLVARKKNKMLRKKINNNKDFNYISIVSAGAYGLGKR